MLWSKLRRVWNYVRGISSCGQDQEGRLFFHVLLILPFLAPYPFPRKSDEVIKFCFHAMMMMMMMIMVNDDDDDDDDYDNDDDDNGDDGDAD